MWNSGIATCCLSDKWGGDKLFLSSQEVSLCHISVIFVTYLYHIVIIFILYLYYICILCHISVTFVTYLYHIYMTFVSYCYYIYIIFVLYLHPISYLCYICIISVFNFYLICAIFLFFLRESGQAFHVQPGSWIYIILLMHVQEVSYTTTLTYFILHLTNEKIEMSWYTRKCSKSHCILLSNLWKQRMNSMIVIFISAIYKL